MTFGIAVRCERERLVVTVEKDGEESSADIG